MRLLKWWLQIEIGVMLYKVILEIVCILRCEPIGWRMARRFALFGYLGNPVVFQIIWDDKEWGKRR